MSLSQVLKESEMDSFLTGNPQVTYFKSVYRRHTPFYKGVHTYTEKPILGEGKQSEELSHGSHDLITNIFLENTITNRNNNKKVYANLGNNIVKDIIFKVGQTELYHTYGLYMEARAELDHPYVPSIKGSNSVPPIMTEVSNVLKCNTGSQYNVQTMAGGVTGSNTNASSVDTFYTYPNFYFCKDYGNAFPICALNNCKVELEINYRSLTDIREDGGGDLKSSVIVEYVNLSDDERLRFINNTDIYYYYDVYEYNYSISTAQISHPLRQIFFVGENKTLDSNTSHSTPVSLTSSLSTSGNIEIKVNDQLLYDKTNNISILTKQNLNRLYPGYGRELGDESNKGYTDSIGVHAFCLDTTNTSSGHLGANTDFNIVLTGDNTSNVRIFLEVIKFYRIMGGQLGSQYI